MVETNKKGKGRFKKHESRTDRICTRVYSDV